MVQIDTEMFKVIGQVAGIGGLSLGIFLILFREVIRKNIFPTLTKSHAYSIIKLMVILIWSLALVGVLGWIFLEYKGNDGVNDNNFRLIEINNTNMLFIYSP